MLGADLPEQTLSSLHEPPYGYPHFISSVVNLLTTLRPRKSFDVSARNVYYGRRGMRLPEYDDSDKVTTLHDETLLDRQTWTLLTIALATLRRWAHDDETWKENILLLLDAHTHVFGERGENPVLKALYDLDVGMYRKVVKSLERPRDRDLGGL